MAEATISAIIDAGGTYGMRVFQDINMAHVWGHLKVSEDGTYTEGGLPVKWFSAPVPPGSATGGSTTLNASPINFGLTPSSAMQPIPTDRPPYRVNFFPGGKDTYRFQYVPPVLHPPQPPDPDDFGKVQIFSSAGSELADDAAIPSQVSGDTELQFEVIVQRS